MPSTPAELEEKPDFMHADIGMVSALALELAPFVARCERVRKYVGGRYTFRGGKYRGVRIAFAECGMGFARARQATQALIDAHTPAWVISAGFAGGLVPETRIGDIVMATSLVDQHDHELSLDLKMPADPEHGLHVGRLLTADQIVRTVADKRDLAQRHQALAVDLETLAVAQVCRDMKTKFVSVRVISDDLTADLPPEILTIMGSTGSMRVGAAMGALWKRPSSLTDMWKLRETARKCSERLAQFLDGVVSQLYEANH